MDPKKENETQAELEPSADADSISEDQDTDQDSESSDKTQKEPESETSNRDPQSSSDASEDESKSETADGIKTEQRLSETEETDQLAEGASTIAEAFAGQGAEKNDEPESDDASDDRETAAPHEADQSDDDSQVADPESKETDPAIASETDDEDLSDDEEAEPAQSAKETQPSEADSDHKAEDDNLTNVKSDGTVVASGAAETPNKEEDRGSAEEKQDDPENDNAEKDQTEKESKDAEAETEDLPELEPKKKIPWVKAAMTVIMVAAVFSGFFIFDNKSNINSTQKATSKEVENADTTKAKYQKTKPTLQPDDPNHIYHAKIKEISMLRETLLRKKEEIGQLKKYYQEGIAELEREIFDEMRSAKTDTFLQALENKRIEFGLRTIQRRHAYVQQLDRPSEWIYIACEELLYLKRRAMFDLQVAEVASNIDMNMHMRHMNSAIEKYRPTADRLAVDMTAAQPESLEKVWEQIQSRDLQMLNNQASSKNRVISEQVCGGTFKRVAELSEISVEAAKCIAAMPGSDLFLNDLGEISPRAAKYLFQWKGSWLCLNGFKALSPRVANYLFQWDGGWISLNGLTEFPAEIGEILLQWQGKQLELMGLRHTNSSFADIGIEYLAQWERSGGILFVPKEVREKIDELNGDSA